MQIYGPYRVSTTQSTSNIQRTDSDQPAEAAGEAKSANRMNQPADELDLSTSAGEVNRMQDASPIAGGGEIRIDRVAEIRRQIADGVYDTPEKMDAAIEHFLDQYA